MARGGPARRRGSHALPDCGPGYNGTFEGAGFGFSADTWQPNAEGCCRLHIRRRSQAKSADDSACLPDCRLSLCESSAAFAERKATIAAWEQLPLVLLRISAMRLLGCGGSRHELPESRRARLPVARTAGSDLRRRRPLAHVAPEPLEQRDRPRDQFRGIRLSRPPCRKRILRSLCPR